MNRRVLIGGAVLAVAVAAWGLGSYLVARAIEAKTVERVETLAALWNADLALARFDRGLTGSRGAVRWRVTGDVARAMTRGKAGRVDLTLPFTIAHGPVIFDGGPRLLAARVTAAKVARLGLPDRLAHETIRQMPTLSLDYRVGLDGAEQISLALSAATLKPTAAGDIETIHVQPLSARARGTGRRWTATMNWGGARIIGAEADVTLGEVTSEIEGDWAALRALYRGAGPWPADTAYEAAVTVQTLSMLQHRSGLSARIDGLTSATHATGWLTQSGSATAKRIRFNLSDGPRTITDLSLNYASRGGETADDTVIDARIALASLELPAGRSGRSFQIADLDLPLTLAGVPADTLRAYHQRALRPVGGAAVPDGLTPMAVADLLDRTLDAGPRLALEEARMRLEAGEMTVEGRLDLPRGDYPLETLVPVAKALAGEGTVAMDRAVARLLARLILQGQGFIPPNAPKAVADPAAETLLATLADRGWLTMDGGRATSRLSVAQDRLLVNGRPVQTLSALLR